MAQLIYTGKTKDVYKKDDNTYTLKLKDSATGKNGVFDTGENTVALSIDGLGRESLKITEYYFNKMGEAGLPHHFISCDINEVTMDVKPATSFGRGLEFLCRVKANGSFIKRYGDYVREGEDLDYLTEVTIKNDDKQDPPITKDALIMLNIMSEKEYAQCKDITKKATKIINDDMAKKGIVLHDIKFEFGKDKQGKVMIIDEVSAGCLRAYKDGVAIAPIDLGGYIL